MAAIAALALAMHASTRKVHILGPSALVGLPDGSVWLGVGRELWLLNAEGELLKKAPGDVGGPSMTPSNLVRHPSGDLVVSYRGDAQLYLLDPETAQLRRRLQPQWPADLIEHSNRAITLAFADDGRLAVSTGGGHAVALFDGEGRFLARTAKGMYQFTNGLWWTASSLWTTDTNRFDLVELNPADLTERQRVHLQDNQLPGTYLGLAMPPSPTHGSTAALGTVVRLLNGMELGHVADVFPDGSQQAFLTPPGFEPRGLHWRANDLLVVWTAPPGTCGASTRSTGRSHPSGRPPCNANSRTCARNARTWNSVTGWVCLQRWCCSASGWVLRSGLNNWKHVCGRRQRAGTFRAWGPRRCPPGKSYGNRFGLNGGCGHSYPPISWSMPSRRMCAMHWLLMERGRTRSQPRCSLS